jgi:predicted RNase H-like HicB family nuclease
MCFKPVQIFAFWDDAAHNWVARSDDLPQINATAESRKALAEKLQAVLAELRERHAGERDAELPVEILWQRPPAADSAPGSDRLRRLEHDVSALAPEELAAFRAWFIAYDDALWDQQMEADAAAGKLDAMAEAALAEHRAGKTKRL